MIEQSQVKCELSFFASVLWEANGKNFLFKKTRDTGMSTISTSSYSSSGRLFCDTEQTSKVMLTSVVMRGPVRCTRWPLLLSNAMSMLLRGRHLESASSSR